MRHEVLVKGGPGFCNALRMSLINDTTSLAACRIHFEANSSCFNNEYLAHRVGMIPFRRIAQQGDGTLRIRAKGPKRVYAKDFEGIGIEPVYGHILIAVLGTEEQQLDLTAHFDSAAASRHARYATVAAVGMRPADAAADAHAISFELVDEQRSPKGIVHEALGALEKRVNEALLALAAQPERPLKSCC